MCEIIFTVNTGNPKPYEIHSVIPQTWPGDLDSFEISNRIYKIFPKDRAFLLSKQFVKRASWLKEKFLAEEAAVKSGFISKPELHFICLIDYIDRALKFAKEHPRTKVNFR